MITINLFQCGHGVHDVMKLHVTYAQGFILSDATENIVEGIQERWMDREGLSCSKVPTALDRTLLLLLLLLTMMMSL